jgi:dihydrolipoamide dehydrogenase
MDKIKVDLVIVGGGPGGYAAAFYAADKGKQVILVEKEPKLGGVCLHKGCIPSKALLQATSLLRESMEAQSQGIIFEKPKVDLERLRVWKNSIIDRLANGIDGLAKKRNVTVINGRGYFEDSQTLRVETSTGQKFINFNHAIIAVGSSPSMPKAFDLGNPRIMTSNEALEIEDIPETLLIVGGGYIGMELGTVYATLGSKVTVIEAMDKILGGADPDLIAPVLAYARRYFHELRPSTKVVEMATKGKKIEVRLESSGKESIELFDKVLVAIGRVPNNTDLGLENTKIKLDQKGFIQVNHQQQTDDPNIYAIGDIAGGVLLAHKASKEARVSVEVLSGELSAFEDIVIPAVVFTNPEIAWCGLTESEAKAKGIDFKVAKFPWSASGRALCFHRPEGITKLIIEPNSERILGVGICGQHAGELISEGVFAIEMGATAKDLAECVHPHPTLSETLMECAEMYYGYSTHAYSPRYV